MNWWSYNILIVGVWFLKHSVHALCISNKDSKKNVTSCVEKWISSAYSLRKQNVRDENSWGTVCSDDGLDEGQQRRIGSASNVEHSKESIMHNHLISRRWRHVFRLVFLMSNELIDKGVLEQSAENKHQTSGIPNVDRLQIRDANLSGHRWDGRHRQNCSNSERYTRRVRVPVDPESYPRQHDDQHWRDVRVHDEVPDFPLQSKYRLQTRVVS